MNSTIATPMLTAMIASGETEELMVTERIFNWLKAHAEEIRSYHLGGFSTRDKF